MSLWALIAVRPMMLDFRRSSEWFPLDANRWHINARLRRCGSLPGACASDWHQRKTVSATTEIQASHGRHQRAAVGL
jgi:hypothetical protein